VIEWGKIGTRRFRPCPTIAILICLNERVVKYSVQGPDIIFELGDSELFFNIADLGLDSASVDVLRRRRTYPEPGDGADQQGKRK